MASFEDFAVKILSGGLPAVLDDPTSGSRAFGDTRVEQTAPSQTVKDTDTFANALTMGDGARILAITVAFAVAIGAAILVFKK